jgi:hypothetical protein
VPRKALQVEFFAKPGRGALPKGEFIMLSVKYPKSLYVKMAQVASSFKVPDYGQPSEPSYTGVRVKETDPILIEDAKSALVHAKALVKTLKKIYGYEPSIFNNDWELSECLGEAADIQEKLEGLIEDE